MALDRAAEAKRQRLGEQELLQAKARAPGVLSKPTAWRSRAYRRADEAGDPQARKRAEERERNKWAKKVVGILVEADVPFGQEVREKGWDPLSPEASRCLRGLRASTLKKRASDVAPFLQYLRGQSLPHLHGRGARLLCGARRGASPEDGLPDSPDCPPLL